MLCWPTRSLMLPVLSLPLWFAACTPDDALRTAPLERPSNETCMALERPATGADVTFTQPWPNLRFHSPVAMRQLPGDDRYWYVVERLGAGESPTDALLSDLPLLATVVAWVAVCAIVLYS